MKDLTTPLGEISGTTTNMDIAGTFDTILNTPVALGLSGSPGVDGNLVINNSTHVETKRLNASYAEVDPLYVQNSANFDSILNMESSSTMHFFSGSKIEIDYNVPFVINGNDISESLGNLNIIECDMAILMTRLAKLEDNPTIGATGPEGMPAPDNSYQINNMESRLIQMEALISKMATEMRALKCEKDYFYDTTGKGSNLSCRDPSKMIRGEAFV